MLVYGCPTNAVVPITQRWPNIKQALIQYLISTISPAPYQLH